MSPGETKLIVGDGDCETVTLDQLLNAFSAPALVKLDVEGSEADVLESAPCLVNEVRLVWVLEVHGSAGERAVRLLWQAGYRIRWIGKGVDVPSDLPVGGPAHLIAIP